MGTEGLTSERTLIERAQGGDRDAFCLLAGRYERRIHSLARHYCRDPHDAEDLSQEVWLRAYCALAGFRAEASFYTWLRQITINTFLNHQRSDTFTARTVQDVYAPTHEGAAETTLHNQLLVAEVMHALAALPTQQRLVFLLKHHEGMTYEEIASALGCQPGTVKKALFRAVEKLRARLHVGADAADAAQGLMPCAAREN
ncbi:MAG TPA: sigma-70 family RNA polymerase sigma factor [Pyrinomonadaceae bacterium]|jgi:RNA polymerase sigma-70 factor (ECF subfamily)